MSESIRTLPVIPEDARLDPPFLMGLPSTSTKDSFCHLAMQRINYPSAQEYRNILYGLYDTFDVFQFPAVNVVQFHCRQDYSGRITSKIITDLGIYVYPEAFYIKGEDSSDLIPFVILHEVLEAWYAAKRGRLGSERFAELADIRHFVARRKQFEEARRAGKGQKLTDFYREGVYFYLNSLESPK